MHRICRAIPAVGRRQQHQLKASQAPELKFGALRMVRQGLQRKQCRRCRTLGSGCRSEVGLVSLCQPERAAAVVTLVPKSLPELQTTKQRL